MLKLENILETFSHHSRTPQQTFTNSASFSNLGCCPENFVMITQTGVFVWTVIQTNRQTGKQSHKQTLLNTIPPRYATLRK